MSQYRDAITGEIILDIRSNDEFIIDVTDTDSYNVEYIGSIGVSKEHSVFDFTSIHFSPNSKMIITKPSDYPRDWTLSFWKYSEEATNLTISLVPNIKLEVKDDKKKEWLHYAYIGTGNTVIEFINGSINNIINIDPKEEDIDKFIFSSNCNIYIDDIIFIAYQKLWTTDFSNNPPKNYLTGFYERKLRNNQIIKPWNPIFIDHYRNRVMTF